MKTLFRFFIAFLAIALAVGVAGTLFGVPFSHSNYWNHHGLLFLALITFFPRLTLLFSSVASGGIVWWLSWLFAPRLLVAILATLAYWHQNPMLVVAAWWVALSGESTEKYVVVKRTKARRKKGYDSAKWVNSK